MCHELAHLGHVGHSVDETREGATTKFETKRLIGNIDVIPSGRHYVANLDRHRKERLGHFKHRQRHGKQGGDFPARIGGGRKLDGRQRELRNGWLV
jgi:hypothetical protein